MLSALIVGLALATTALGTLLPILRDAGLLDSRFGTYVLAVGTVGEFGPIVAVALLLTSDAPWHTALLLCLFVAITVAGALVAMRPQPPQIGRLLDKHMNTSAQLPVRVVVLLVFVLVWLASLRSAWMCCSGRSALVSSPGWRAPASTPNRFCRRSRAWVSVS